MMGQGDSRERDTESTADNGKNSGMNMLFEVGEDDDDLTGSGKKASPRRGTEGGGNLPIITPYVKRRMSVTARLRGTTPTATSLAQIHEAAPPSNAGGPLVATISLELDKWIEKLYNCEALAECEVLALCVKAKEVLLLEPSVKHVQAPISVCGDIHGQVGNPATEWVLL